MKKQIEYGGKYVTIEIKNPCNYNCYYCVAKRQPQEIELFDFEKIQKKFDQLIDFTMTVFDCGAGEPTIHPQIKKLLELCLKYGPVSIPTNLSFHPRYWLPKDNSAWITVRATLHPENEANISRFVDHLTYLKDHGVPVTVLFICHPKRNRKKKFFKEFFKEFQIPFKLIPYTGEYEGIEYPYGYNGLERRELGLEKQNDWVTDLSFETTWRNFKKIPCLAGYIDIYMNSQGQIYRCLYDKSPLDKPYTTPKPCYVNNCGCGFILKALNNRGPEFWNKWRKMAGLEELQEEKYEDYIAFLSKKREIYHRLRRKYESNQPVDVIKSIEDVDGVDICMKKLFMGNESIDFIGIGHFFNKLATSKNFNKIKIGNLFDNSYIKQGTFVEGKIIQALSGFPKSKLSKKLLLSVQFPESLKDLSIEWLKGEKIQVYYLQLDENNQLSLRELIV